MDTRDASVQLDEHGEPPERMTLPLDVLYFDPNNYRLVDHAYFRRFDKEDEFFRPEVQDRVRRSLIGTKQVEIEDLLASFQLNGWLEMEPVRVRQVGNLYLIVDGNRRVAALTYLRGIHRAGNSIGALEPAIFEKLPVVVVADHDSLRGLMKTALTHIGGKRRWPLASQAFVLRELEKHYQKSVEEICQSLGISLREFYRSLAALTLADTYKKSRFGHQYNPQHFLLFREAVDTSIVRWLSWNEEQDKPSALANLNRLLSWFSSDDAAIKDEVDVEEMTLSSPPPGPILQNPNQVRQLARIVQYPEAVRILDETRDLSLALSTAVNQAPGTSISQTPWNPYQDVREKHFEAIEVVNYRGLQDVRLDNPGRINLIAGINNTGKTSFLEAIYLLTRQSDSRAILEVVRRRAHTEKIPETKVLLALLPLSASLKGRYENHPFHYDLRVSTEPEDEQIDRATFERELHIRTQYGDKEQNSRTTLQTTGRPQIRVHGEARFLCPAEFSSPFSLAEPASLVAANEASSKAGVKKEIIEFLRETLVDGLESIELVNALSRFHVREHHRQQPEDLATYGEGMQRIFHIAMLFANARQGVMLIDEFENAIHVRALVPFASLLQQLALKFQVQVFLSTHSAEVIDAWTSSEKLRADVVGYGLRRTEDKRIEAVRFDGERIHKLKEAFGFDLRGLA